MCVTKERARRSSSFARSQTGHRLDPMRESPCGLACSFLPSSCCPLRPGRCQGEGSFLNHEPIKCVAVNWFLAAPFGCPAIEENNSEKFARTQTYNVANRNVATVAAIRLLLKDKTLPIRVATNTKMAERLMFAQFKYDQSMEIMRRLIIEGREKSTNGPPSASTPVLERGALYPLQASLMAARSSSTDELTNDGSLSARNTS
jgi:hypothetical protein